MFYIKKFPSLLFVTLISLILIVYHWYSSKKNSKMSYKCLKNNGASIEETLGNWGFSNRVSNSGQELRRLRCLFNKMDGM